MTMTDAELDAYHLKIQAGEIAAMQQKTEPYENDVAGLTITVLPNVYPGGIDSELMSAAIGDTSNKTVLDLCTGTGLVALNAAINGAKEVVAIDLNPEAVKNATFNARKFGLPQIDVREGSLFKPVADEKFDIISFVPPFSNKKPANKTEICFWDEDNATTRRFFEQYKQYVKPGGKVYFAWADFADINLIADLAKTAGVRLELLESKSTGSELANFLVYELVST
jgi:release factor glutamine methyltransferase